MILRRGQPPQTAESDGRASSLMARRLSDAGGLTQIGAHVHSLEPGARASDRHWHETEDELIYVLSGEITVIDDDGEQTLLPGDAACWPAGTPNAHCVINRSAGPASYFVCGTRRTHDVVHYPEIGQTLFIEGTSWRIEADDGTVLKNGYWNEAERRCASCGEVLERSEPGERCAGCRG